MMDDLLQFRPVQVENQEIEENRGEKREEESSPELT